VKEILGPRAGPHETLDQDPLEEYITGILAPTRKKIDPSDMERAADLPAGDSEEGEDEQPDADVQAPPRFSPTLDPKTLPSSMGLSFRLTCNTTPRLDVRVTWARYQRDRDGDKKVWKRQPRWAIIHGLDVSKKDEIFLDANGKQCDRSQAEVSLQIQRVKSPGTLFPFHLSGQQSFPTRRITEYPLNIIYFNPKSGSGVRKGAGLIRASRPSAAQTRTLKSLTCFTRVRKPLREVTCVQRSGVNWIPNGLVKKTLS